MDWKKTVGLFLLLAVVLSVSIVFAGGQQSNEQRGIQRWEFTSLHAQHDGGLDTIIERANRLGEEGWELVTTNSNFFVLALVFKRPLP